MRFLIDAQLPPALARLLKAAGHQAEHVEDVGLRDAGDHRIWDYTVQQQAVLITKDEDFTARLSREAIRSGDCLVADRQLHAAGAVAVV